MTPDPTPHPARQPAGTSSSGTGPRLGETTARAEAAGLYLHVPFCSAICPYCDFYVLTGAAAERSRFAELLSTEIRRVPDAGLTFDTVYLGGGTPSLLELPLLDRLLGEVRARFCLLPASEIYLEANPEDVTAERLSGWRRLGVGFLSLGIQSFDPASLRFLGRRHTAGEGRRAVERAREAGFGTLSLDLIYGLPGQDAAAWRRELETALALGPDHLSCYELTIHPGTPFGFRRARGRLTEADETERAELFHLTHETLAAAGYPAYEVSNFARRPEHRSRHNRKYWRHGAYLGFGPSAHSFSGRRRWWNRRKIKAWRAALEADQLPVEAVEELSDQSLRLEALMLGFRTVEGVDLEALEMRFGGSIGERNAGLIARLEQEGLLVRRASRLVPTLRGLALADGLARRFEV